jgi:hypothetical protein
MISDNWMPKKDQLKNCYAQADAQGLSEQEGSLSMHSFNRAYG